MKVTWSPSSDDVGVAGYYLYKNGALVSNTDGTSAIFGAGIPLTCGTSYTFGVAAYDAVGNHSEVASIIASTSPCADTQAPSAPSGVAQIAKTASSATVSWSPSSDNVGVVGYGAYQGGIRVADTAQTSYTFANLACGTSTTVGLDAYDAAGNRSAATSFVVSTSACSDIQPPTAPTGLTKTGSTDTSIAVKWNPSTDNVGVASYQLISNGAVVGSTTGTSYTISGLTCGKSYTIGVAAYDAAGNHSSWASAAMATSACPPPPSGSDTTPPTTPTNLGVTSTTVSSIRVSWSASTDNVGVTGYDLYKNGALLSTTTGTDVIFGAGIPLTCGTSYTFGVKAYDAAGNRSPLASIIASTSACSPSQQSGDTTPPTAPTMLTVVSNTASSIRVSWSPSTDNVAVTGYDLYKDGALLSTTTGTDVIFGAGIPLSCGTSYTFGVKAYDAAGNRSTLASIIASTSACADSQAPSVPSNVTMSSRTATSISFTWSASTDNVGVVGYGVYNGGASVGTTPSTSYTVTGLSCGMTYTIGVDAYDASGNRSTQAAVMMATTACSDTQPPTAPANLTTSNVAQTSVTLSWTASTDNLGVAGYDMFANGTKIGGSTTATSNVLAGLTCGTSYTLGVEAFDAAGNRSPRATKAVTTGACATSGPTLYISPSGSDGNPCTQSAPCASFNRAYHVATPGSTVLALGGTYPAQTITYDAAKASATQDVTLKAASGATVDINGEFLVGTLDPSQAPHHITIEGIDVTGGGSALGPRCAHDITFRNDNAIRGVTTGSQNINYYGGSYGGSIDAVWNITDGPCSPNSNLLMDGVTFHDALISSTDPGACGSPNGCHSECLQQDLGTVTGYFIIRNSTFENCQDFGMLINGGVSNFTFENNFVDNPFTRDVPSVNCSPGCARGGSSLRIDDKIANGTIVVRYNTFLGNVNLDPGFTSAQVYGNIADRRSCDAGVSYSYNVFSGATCGTGDKQASLSSLFLDGDPSDGNMNLHLRTGVAAADSGDPNRYPTADVDGQARPLGGRSDSGADEAS